MKYIQAIVGLISYTVTMIGGFLSNFLALLIIGGGEDSENWWIFLVTTAVLLVISTLFFFVFGSAEVQVHWDDADESGSLLHDERKQPPPILHEEQID